MFKECIENANRIVVKIGSALLVDEENGQLHRAWLNTLIEDITALHQSGKKVIIVSSGAIALGRKQLGLMKTSLSLPQQQAAAATGQVLLVHAYQESFADYKTSVAQMLLTLSDSEDRTRYLNAKNTLENLLELGVIPIINENDTVATAEIRFGDNDRLAARVAQMAQADAMVLLSDIDGLYDSDPTVNKDAKFIAEVEKIDQKIEAMATGSTTHTGSGGMITKVAAAKIATASGCHLIICNGRVEHPLQISKGTWFKAQTTPLSARKNWLAHQLHSHSQLIIDAGAADALKQGKSLLPVGVTGIEGEFDKGDAVKIIDQNQNVLAKGLMNYSSRDAQRLLGKHSDEISAILGYEGSEELIHRDNLVMLSV